MFSMKARNFVGSLIFGSLLVSWAYAAVGSVFWMRSSPCRKLVLAHVLCESVGAGQFSTSEVVAFAVDQTPTKSISRARLGLDSSDRAYRP